MANDHLLLKSMEPASKAPVHSGGVRVQPQCHFYLPIQVVLPVILSFRRKTPSLVYSETSSVFTFTSCLFFDISLRAVHTVWLRRTRGSPPRSLAGLGGRSPLAVRKLALIGLVAAHSQGPRMLPGSLSWWASWNESNALCSAAAPAARQVESGDVWWQERKKTRFPFFFLNKKGLKSIERKVQTHAMLIYLT